MSKIVFDIETVGQDFELLDDTSKEYFLKFAKDEEEVAKAKDSLSFYPLTAQIVTIAMVETDSDKGYVFFQNGGKGSEKFTEDQITFVAGDEKAILMNFWKVLKNYSQFVTFNGRTFDCPFVMLRSAMHNIKSLKNMVPYRYNHNLHIDLADQLSFYGAMQRRFSLHMWCQAFNIKSPKDEGTTGLQVKDMYKQGRHKDIARYCVGDVKATKELFHYWDKNLKF